MSPSSNNDSKHPRLQKVLAAGGFGSRRQCEQLILEGRVDVDRKVVTELGVRVDSSTQNIRVDGVPLRLKRQRYFAVHKPTGVLSTARDQWGRTRVIDLVDAKERVFTIGRLDKESSGLILVTNDGELANRLTHPRYGVEKVYHVTVVGTPTNEVLQKLRRGMMLSEGPVRPESVKIKKRLKQSTTIEMVLAEGKNREIRRMLARVGHKVVKLHRVAMGPVRLGQLPKGTHRELSRTELTKLRALLEEKPQQKKKAARKRPSGSGRAKVATKQGSTRKKKITRSVRLGAVLGGDPAETKQKSGSAKGRRKKTGKAGAGTRQRNKTGSR